MKLAFCLFKYFPFGGLQRDFLRIAKESVQRGHQVDVFTMAWEGAFEPSIAVNIIPVKGLQNHVRAQQFVAQIQAQLASYDLVVGFNKMPGLDLYYAADTCYQAKTRRMRGVWYRLIPRYRHLIAYEKAVFAADKNTKILLLSDVQQAEFARYYGTPANRFQLLPPGIATDRIAPTNATEIRQDVRKRLGIQAQEFLLLQVGSGFKTKGLDRTLIAFAALPAEIKNRSYLYVVGQDNPKIFQSQAKKLNITSHVKFLGGRNDVADLLLAADLLLHPAYNENTGTVLLEALVAGLPVLTTDVCGYAHFIVAAEAGRVLPSPFQQIAFNQCLADMLLRNERVRWQKNALAFAKTADIYSLPKRAVDAIEEREGCKEAVFTQMMRLEGEVYRELEGRCTRRVVWKDKAYFIKQHKGVGWKEIFKNIFQLKMPIISAKNEWHALQRLRGLNIPCPKVVSFKCRGINPAKVQSYIITHELEKNISLEDLTKDWREIPPAFKTKQALIKAVAYIARTLHKNGMNHRDFYLCHFLLDLTVPIVPNPKIYLIDLHRAGLRKCTPMRWIIKDLAGLYFSSKKIGLTHRDLLRFIKEYCNKSLYDGFINKKHFWQKVTQRGDKLYREHE
jgi:UDP-glucose:(heptosyl)LPS alpha-1,3-glucosyltransferase